jgi:hypothetical protein
MDFRREISVLNFFIIYGTIKNRFQLLSLMKKIPNSLVSQWEKGTFFSTALKEGRKLIMNSMMSNEL